MMHTNKTVSLKSLKSVAICALFSIMALPSICAASLFPIEDASQSIPVNETADKCDGLSIETPPEGCFFPCQNPYKLKDGTKCCADTQWRAMPEEYIRPAKNDACYDTDAVLAADGEYCYKQTPSDTYCDAGFVWNDFNASYDKAQNYCSCVAVKCPQGSSTEKKNGCYTYRDTGQKSGHNTCWLSVPLSDKCPEGQTKNAENCQYGYDTGDKTECGSQCYKCQSADNHCLPGQVKDSSDCLYGYTHGGKTQSGAQCYDCKAPTCAFFMLVDECAQGCADGVFTTCKPVTPQGTPLNCFEKTTEVCAQGCDGKHCASKKCEDFGFTDNCSTGCANGVQVTCKAQDPGFGLRCFEKIEEKCAQGCNGNSCTVKTCETGGYVSSCTENCSENVSISCKPVDYDGLICYEKTVETCTQGCASDGLTCNKKSCSDGGYVDSCGKGCKNNILTTCTFQQYYGLSCYSRHTENCAQGCTDDGLDCNRRICEDGGYTSTCVEGCSDNTQVNCTKVDYFGLTCYEKKLTTCEQGCAEDGLICDAKSCAAGGYVDSCRNGCQNGTYTECKEVEYFGKTCYEKQTKTCKQGCTPDNMKCNVKTCLDGGYIERCVAGCSGTSKTICNEVQYYGLTCYDRQVENCAQGCSPDGKTCISKTCSDFSDKNGVRLIDSCAEGCSDNQYITCKVANPGYGLECYTKKVSECVNGCADAKKCNMCPTGYTTEKTGECYNMAVGADGKTVCYKETPCCTNNERMYAPDKPMPEEGYDIIEAQGHQGGYCYKAKKCPGAETTVCVPDENDTQCTVCNDTENYNGVTRCQRAVLKSNQCPEGQTKNNEDCANGYVLGNKTECGTQCYRCDLCPEGFVTRAGAQCYYSELGADGKTMCYQNVECCEDKARVYSPTRPRMEKGYDVVEAQGSQGGYCYKEKACPDSETLECKEDIRETHCVSCQKTENYSGLTQCQKKIIKSNICGSGQAKDTKECIYGYELGDTTECGEQCYACKVCPTGYSTGTNAVCYETKAGLDGVTTCYKDVKCCFGEDKAYSLVRPKSDENLEITAANGAQGGYCYRMKK